MMSKPTYPRAVCWICGEEQCGSFTDPQQECDQHSAEERSFFMSIDKQEIVLSKADRAMRRAYMLRWRKPYVQLHPPTLVKELRLA